MAPFSQLWRQTNQNSGGGFSPSPAPAYSITPEPIPETNPFSNPAEEWGTQPSTDPFNLNNEENQAEKRLYDVLTSPSTIIIGGSAVFVATVVILEKYTSVKPSQIAAAIASGALTATDALEMFIQPAFTAYAEEYEELEAYVYGDGDDFNTDNSSKEDALTEEIKNEDKDYEKASKAAPPRDPLAIDFGASGIELTTLENGVYFDLDNNGFAEKTAWIGTEDGFLTLDLNGNGKIDNGGELFGDQFIMSDGQKSSFGFEALADFDENEDGDIDENDAVFASLLVWIDENQNGISEPEELHALENLNIVSISLDYSESNFLDTETGTLMAESSNVTYLENEVQKTRTISEFWFDVDTSDTTQGGETTVGNVPSIFQAIEEDETGELMVLYLCFEYADDVAVKRYYLKQILYFITGANDIAANSRGGNIDARDIHVIEQFMGREFEGVSGANPNAPAAVILKGMYTNIENLYFSILSFQGDFEGYMHTVYESVDDSGQKTLDLSFFNFIIGKKLVNGENVDTLVYDLGVYLKSFDEINGTNVFNDYSTQYSTISSHYAEIVELADSDIYTFIGTEDTDNFKGTNNVDYVFGENGNDILYGSNGNDLLDGGQGSDNLYGNEGDDTYIFGLGYGTDLIRDNSGTNKIKFLEGINPNDVVIKQYGSKGVLISINGVQDSIEISDYLSGSSYRNFTFEFSDGTVWSLDDLTNKLRVVTGTENTETISAIDSSSTINAIYADSILYGLGGNDTLRGSTGNDTLYGGIGDDYLYGSSGNDLLDGGQGSDNLYGNEGDDTYIFGLGYGTDLIRDNSGTNKIKFLEGINPNDVVIKQYGSKGVLISINGVQDSIEISDYLSGSSYRNFMLYKFCITLQGTFADDLISAFIGSNSGDLGATANIVLSSTTGLSGLLGIFTILALAYCVIKLFFANIKRGGILLCQIAVGSLYMFSIPRGYTDGFNGWCKQIFALCLTAFLQTTLLFLGLLTWQTNMVLGLGVMLAANEVPRIAQMYGLDTSVKVNMMSVTHTVNTAVSAGKFVAKKLA